MAIPLDGGIPSRRNGRTLIRAVAVDIRDIELDSRLGDRSSQHPGSAFLGNKLFLTLTTEAQHRQVQNFVSKTRVTRQSGKAEKTV